MTDFFGLLIKEMQGVKEQNSEKVYSEIAHKILENEKRGNRLHLTGVGKSSYVAGYIASLLSSTGTKAYYLDATEAVHGSLGQVDYEDSVIAISNSGETQELKATVINLKNNGASIIAVTGNKDSWLAKNSDYYLIAKVEEEGDDLNKPPRLSVIAQISVLQKLSLILQNSKNIQMEKYLKWHPGGAIGKTKIA